MNTITRKKGTQLVRILEFLRREKEISAETAKKQLRVANLSAGIFKLRKLGFKIVQNRKTIRTGPNRGERVTVYELGQ